MRFISKFTNGNRVDIDCYSDKLEDLTLKIYDLDSNLMIIEYIFQLSGYIGIWSTFHINFKDYEFLNGCKIIIFNNNNNDKIEYDEVFLKKSYCKTKFIDKDNLLTQAISCVLHSNLIETEKNFKDDFFDLKNSDVILDLGSSIGVFTAYALERNPNIKSINVEMNPSFHKICMDTFLSNPNIIPINAAIYKTSGEKIKFMSSAKNTYDLGNTIIPNGLYDNQTYSTEIDTISIDHIILKYNVDRISLLKVDIEGYEYELFENLSDDFFNIVDKIFFEFHKVDNNDRKMSLINRLQRLGFKMNLLYPVDMYNEQMFTIYFKK